MRAWRINDLGHPAEKLEREDLASPQPEAGQIHVAVEATTINFADILLCQGIYQDRPGIPFTPGLETSGRVLAHGEGVDPDSFPVGSRVMGMAALPHGGYAEESLIRANTALAMPDSVDAGVGTVLYSTYQTAHVAIHHRAQIQPGEWLLVHGASGGVGSAAVQLGLAAGAIVVATAGGEAKAQFCADLGAHHVIDYTAVDFSESLKELTGGRGVDVAFDAVGGDLGEATRRLMAWEGRLVVIGFASGGVPNYPANHLLVKNYTIMGLHWGAMADHGGRPVIEAAHEHLMQLYADGAIAPPVADAARFDDLVDAMGRLERRSVTGRLVFVP